VLNKAVDNAFGSLDYKHPDYNFVNELKYNNGVFAAFKTHRQQNDLAGFLLDDEGSPRSFHQFEKACRPTLEGYNKNWLQTEYVTATNRARFAANFKAFERNKHVAPNLEWLPSRSAEPRSSHRDFYGVVLPMDDPFWQEHHPGDEYNCKCGIQQTSKPVKKPKKTDSKPHPGLEGNPAKTEQLFSFNHAYYQEGYSSLKKLKPIAQAKVEEQFVRFKTIKKYKSGGKVLQHSLFDQSVHDAKDLVSIAKNFAQQGNIVLINPTKLHYKDKLYNLVFNGLKGSKYYRKNPDLTIGGKYFEYESYTTAFNKRKVGSMIRHGAEQSSRIIINNKAGSSEAFVLNRIKDQIKQGKLIDEVWIWDGKKLKQVYP
jgi:hypothetical protein